MPAATPFLQVRNRASSTTAGVVDGISDPVVVAVQPGDGANFPSFPGNPFHITIDDEILACTNRVVDALTCTRAQEGTVIAAHGTPVAVQLRVTAQLLSALDTAVNACETVGAFTNEAETITAKWTWSLVAGISIARRIPADAQDRTYWSEDRIAWGTGAVAADTEIGRGGANLLTTPDDIQFGAGPATAGVIRLSNATYIYARNGAGAANYRIIGLDGANNISMQAHILHAMAAGAVAFSAYVLGEANPKTTIEHGQIQFGPGGAAAVDVNLYRGGADILRSDDAFRDDAGFFSGVAPSAIRVIDVEHTFTDLAGILTGVRSSPNVNPGAGSAAELYGFRSGASVNAACAQDITGSVTGLYSTAIHAGSGTLSLGVGVNASLITSGAGSITLGYGVYVQAVRSAGAGNITTLRMIDIENPSGGLAPTTLVGLYIAALTAGVTSISLQSLGGHMRHVGAATFGANATPAVGSIIDLATTTGALLLSRLTTGQVAALPGVADGMFLYNSTIPGVQARVNGSWITLGIGNTPGPSMSSSHLFEEFLGGNITAGTIGELGWHTLASGTAFSKLVGLAGHPGVLRATTGAGAYYGYLYLGYGAAFVAQIDPVDYFDITKVFRAGAASTHTFRVGLFGTLANPPADGLYIEKTTGDANWFFTTRSGGVDRTRTDTGIPVDTGWRKIRIWRTSAADISFKLDAGGITIHNTSIPTNPLGPVFYVLSTAAVTFDADAMDLYVNSLTR